MNYLEALNYGNKILKSCKIINYNLDSQILLSKVLNLSRERLLINLSNNLETANFNKFKKLVLRRKKKEPIAYIFKNREFWKYNFKVNRGVLIPRPETEIIINKTLKFISLNASKKILDIGTGSGCIILSILKERPKCHGTAIDISKKALKVAITNAKMHHLQNKIKFINNDIDKFSYNKYDFILSNPPYIKNSEIIGLESNIKLYEPKIALGAGVDGLREIKKLIIRSKNLLKLNGKLIFEIGNNQIFHIMNILKKNSFYIDKICYDLRNYPRVIISTKLN